MATVVDLQLDLSALVAGLGSALSPGLMTPGTWSGTAEGSVVRRND